MPAEEGMGGGYSWVPSGLAFRLYPEKNLPAPEETDLELRGLNDGTVYLSPEALHVRLNYALMLVNYGTCRESREGPSAGLPYYRRALEVDPECTLARKLLAR